MRFAHLHGHTTYSFLDGYGLGSQIAQRVSSLGQTHVAITDHGNVCGHVPCYKPLRDLGITPILGCEFYICDNMKEKGVHAPSLYAPERGPGPLPHITILAKTQIGYQNLLMLSRLSFQDGFHYKPRIDFASLLKYQEGLIVLSGCPGGYLARAFMQGLDHYAYQLAEGLKNAIDDYYIELTPQPGLDISHATFDKILRLALDLRILPVVTADAHFPQPTDHEAQDLMLAVGLRKTLADPTRELRLPAYQYYCSGDEVLGRCQQVSIFPIEQLAWCVENSQWIADQCQVELPKGKRVLFHGTPKGQTADQLLWTWVEEGLRKRWEKSQIPPTRWAEYVSRAQREFEVIKSKGYSDYILSITDVVRAVKEQGSLVNLRGSAGGSLLLWLLSSSEIDPIYYGLSFERFYDETRQDPPDVDVDFEKAWRPKAFEYVYEKYGKQNCSQITALSKLGARGALQDAAFAYGIPRAEFEPLSKLLDTQDEDTESQFAGLSDPTAQAVLKKYPQLNIISKMVGQFRQSSVHAAGMIISSEPLDKFIGIMIGSDNQPVSAVDKRGIAQLGLLKMDFLSVGALDVIGNSVRLINKHVGHEESDFDWLYGMPRDDTEVIKLAAQGLLAGVFQLSGSSAARAARDIGVDTFDDLVAAIVLCRPGPSDHIPLYVRHKRHPEELAVYLAKFHPIVQNIVKDTFGILMYQEQIMAIARDLAGLESKHVHQLRKDVVDKVGLDPNKGNAWRVEWHQRFVEGCLRNGVSLPEAEFWWVSVQTHGSYSFNKSHGVSYGVVAYWTLWLKKYWPSYFYQSCLQVEEDIGTKKSLVMEFIRCGGKVDLLSPQYSTDSFKALGPNHLVGGYLDLNGVGPATSKALSAKGPFNNWDELLKAMPKALREKIVRAGINSGHVDPQELLDLAPWCPLKTMPESDQIELMSIGANSLGSLPQDSLSGDITVGGYVTATGFREDKIKFIIEDPSDAILVRVAGKNVPHIGHLFRQLKPGDLVAVTGWWTGDSLIAKDCVVLRKKICQQPQKSKKQTPSR